MLALVTGGGGFLGQAIVEHLRASGQRVRCLARGHYPELAALGVECVRADVRDRAAVRAACAGVDVVYHTAALAGIWGPRRDYFEINVVGTQHVIAGCRAERVAKLVYTSSPSVTFDGRPQENVDERAPYPRRWLCHYARTKAEAERQVLAANGSDLLTCALRPHLIWGPGDPHLIPRLIARARAGALRRVGDGKNQIDMVYVDNAAQAHLQAAASLAAGSPVAGSAYFISQGASVNCWQWIDEILSLAAVPPVEKSIPLRIAWRIGGMLEAVHWLLRKNSEPRMTRFLAAQLGTSHFFDISRARRDFGYEPAVSTAEGMRRLGAWLQGSPVASAKDTRTSATQR